MDIVNPPRGRNRVVSWLLPPDGGGSLPRVVFWNTMAGGVYAGATSVLQMLASRWVDTGDVKYWSGVLGLALALSQQMAPLGVFGASTYQVSDQRERYSFPDYVAARVLSTGGMLLAGLYFGLSGRLSADKAGVFLLFLLLRASESFAGVFGSRYQQKGRLDATSRIGFVKNAGDLLAFVLLLWTTRNVFVAAAGMAAAHFLLFFALDRPILPFFRDTARKWSFGGALRILRDCLPLAANAFLIMYVNNGAKFAVDAVLDVTELARFCALFMTTFGLAMLADFLTSPQLAPLSDAYLRGDRRTFNRILGRLALAIAALGAVGLAVAALWGVQILSWFFYMDLHSYRNALCVSFLGGALLPFYHLGMTVLVIQRRQNWSLLGIALAAGFVRFASEPLVRAMGLQGGCVCYLCAVGLLVAATAAVAAWFMRNGE